jgi:transposase-like protein
MAIDPEIKAAAIDLLKSGEMRTAEIAELLGQSRQLVATWCPGAREARRKWCATRWAEALTNVKSPAPPATPLTNVKSPPAAPGFDLPPFLLDAMAEQDRRNETYKKLMADSPKHKKPKR